MVHSIIFSSSFLLVLLQSVFTEASWWLLAMPSAYEMTLQMKNNYNYKEQCLKMAYLVERQRQLCTLNENLLSLVSRGAQMGLAECRNQFSGRHWNCSTLADNPKITPYLIRDSNAAFTKKMLRDQPLPEPSRKNSNLLTLGFQSDAPASKDVGDVFGQVLNLQTREKAFLHAVSAAGVAHSITLACRDGRLSSCNCDTNIHRNKKYMKQQNGTWDWGGCSDDIGYGQQISKDFVDANDLARLDGEPAPTLMNLHNNHAGRLAIKANSKLKCKCHGVSGSCTTKICWREMSDFESVGKTLYRKFENAKLVTFNMQRHKLKAIGASQDQKVVKRLKRRDLVYLQESPDYCEMDSKYGIAGTKGRECRLDSYGVENCNVLCCNRGYKTVTTETTRECNCNFVWCCEVKCSQCVTTTERYYCN